MEQLRQFRVALCCALVAFSAWRATTAQETGLAEKAPAEKAIVQLLNSDDPREMAWGAHYAMLAKNEKLNADLVGVAGQWRPLANSSEDKAERPMPTPEQMEQRDGMAAVLDALIELHVAVPPETLRGLAADFPNDVAILLSRLPEDEYRGVAMEYFRKGSGDGYSLQYVSAALLAKSPPDGFAAQLLAGIDVQAKIFIVLPDQGMGSGSSADCLGMPVLKRREDWPLFGSYHLTRMKQENASRFLSAPDPIYIKRNESTHYESYSCPELVLCPEDRRKLLAYMLKIPAEEIGWQTQFIRNIFYHSPQELDFDLRSLMDGEQGKYRVTAQLLVQKGLMADSEIEQSLPLLHLHCMNYAGKELATLLEPSPLPARVRWEPGFF